MRTTALQKRSPAGRIGAICQIAAIRQIVPILIALCLPIAFASCSRSLGYGLLLWSVDEPSVPSGTVVKVYIKSNIDGVWVVGVPDSKQKLELPLWQLDFIGSRGKAADRAEAFAPYAATYAEAVQDGLPIRAEPDNGARRVYRLRQGQIVKVLGKAEGNPAMAGDAPLPGDWLSVLTEDGAVGYCFSYRLRVFDQAAGKPASAGAVAAEAATDPDMDYMASQLWYPEAYKEMIDSRRIDLSRFTASYGFFPGQDSGLVRISLPGLSAEYPYASIQKVRDGVWRFEGTSVQVTLRSKSVLAVQHTDGTGAQKSYVFVTLPVEARDLIDQETERRAALFAAIASRGPSFRSENYGQLSFSEGAAPGTGSFEWTGYDLLVPSAVPAGASGTGAAELPLFLDESLQGRYDGALSLRFDGLPPGRTVDFLYNLEPEGLRLEYAPPSCIDGIVVKQRASAPIVISFSRSER